MVGLKCQVCSLDGDFTRIWVQASLISRAQEGQVRGLKLKPKPAFETWSSSIYQSGTVSLKFSRGAATVLSTRRVSSPLLFQAAENSYDSPTVGHRPPAQMAQWQSWDSNPSRAFLSVLGLSPWSHPPLFPLICLRLLIPQPRALSASSPTPAPLPEVPPVLEQACIPHKQPHSSPPAPCFTLPEMFRESERGKVFRTPLKKS